MSDDGFSRIVFTDNSSRYAQRVEPAYDNSNTLKQKIATNTANIATNTANITAINNASGSKVIVHSVDVVTTSSQSLTANTPAEITGLSVTLTPQSANSKFLLMANWNGEGSHTDIFDAVFGFKRDSSYIGNHAAAGARLVGRGILSQGYWNSDASTTMDSWDGQYVDEPNTTNSITYKVFIHTRYAQTLYNNMTVSGTDTIGRERATSSLIILEII